MAYMYPLMLNTAVNEDTGIKTNVTVIQETHHSSNGRKFLFYLCLGALVLVCFPPDLQSI